MTCVLIYWSYFWVTRYKSLSRLMVVVTIALIFNPNHLTFSSGSLAQSDHIKRCLLFSLLYYLIWCLYWPIVVSAPPWWMVVRCILLASFMAALSLIQVPTSCSTISRCPACQFCPTIRFIWTTSRWTTQDRFFRRTFSPRHLLRLRWRYNKCDGFFSADSNVRIFSKGWLEWLLFMNDFFTP